MRETAGPWSTATRGAIVGVPAGVLFGLFYGVIGVLTALRVRRALLAAAEDAEPFGIVWRTACLASTGLTLLLGWSLALLVVVLMLFHLFYVEGLAMLGLITGPVLAIPYSVLTGSGVAVAVAYTSRRGRT